MRLLRNAAQLGSCDNIANVENRHFTSLVTMYQGASLSTVSTDVARNSFGRREGTIDVVQLS